MPNRQRSVDIHAHVHVQAAEELVRPAFTPDKLSILRFTTPETQAVNARTLPLAAKLAAGTQERLAEMDATGIDIQALSPSPGQYYYWADPELGRAAARTINDAVAGMAAEHRDRFVALGTVPLQEPRLAVDELRRCVRDLGMRGVEIDTNVCGAEISGEALRPFWAAAEELDVLVFIHPLGFTHGERLSRYYFTNLIGNPLESTIAISYLIFDGVLDAYPGLKICVAHGGGFLPMYAGRMAHAYRHREDVRGPQHSPETYLRHLYYDSVVYDGAQLEALVKWYGSDHVLLGTDWPYDMRELDPIGLVNAVPGLDDEARDAICGGNAAHLLKLAPPT
jgi:aminocarboxymuconate-semialdehyde decarboxylase